MKELDPLYIPLYGTHIIEASAGTGKTYAISNIFLRFILERQVSVENILIVSFTESATNELKYRIRKRLQEALNALTGGTRDSFIERLLNKIEKKEAAKKFLKAAIRELDSLTLSTIHGFCRSIILDNALETGILLDADLIVDQEPIKREIVYDFWRRYIYHQSPLFLDYLIKNRFDPDNVFQLIDIYLARPYIKMIPDPILDDPIYYEEKYINLMNKLFKLWTISKDEIKELFYTNKALNKRIYNKRNIEKWFEYMDQFINLKGYEFANGEIIKRFSKKYIANYLKPGFSCPDHMFFELLNELVHIHNRLEAIYKNRLIFLKRKLINHVVHELRKKKLSKNMLSFDDLIMIVYNRLQQQELLLETVRNRFVVGMIDEFQDTDPIQYQIFKTIFDKDDHALYLIGDPKQSIYSFRGADIFTYIKASKEINSKFTLRENWRSYSGLVESINKIFSIQKRPFLYKEISFFPSKPAKGSDVKPLLLNNKLEACLKLWVFDEKEYNKSTAKEIVAKVVAEEISRLIHLGKKSKLLIGNKSVTASDIAVLVRRNSEANLIQEELSKFHIPTVVYSTTNIFSSWECIELIRILLAIFNYNNIPYIKAALATDIMGFKLDYIEDMNEGEWENWIRRFHDYNELWDKYGFMAMFREFLNKESVIPRLMRFINGERRCTNILHLIEVVHRAEKEYFLGMERLIKWLSDQRDDQVSRTEDYQLRLESDKDSVKIITIHRSKGLEFPIVFLPFAWDRIKKIKSAHRPVIFHDPNNRSEYILDIGSDHQNNNESLEMQEYLAEDIRLLYVGLTRAKNCCYLVCGKIEDFDKSALSYLLQKDIYELRETLTENKILISPIPELKGGFNHFEDMPKELFCKTFSRPIHNDWGVTSFSSLISNKTEIDEPYDVDLLIEEAKKEDEDHILLSAPMFNIFSFPKGAKAGIFFHDLLEHLDFTQNKEGVKQLISSKLQEYGFEKEWEEPIYHTIKDLLEINLDPEIKGLSLSKISLAHRINELEFYFPLKKISAQGIEQFLKQYGFMDSFDYNKPVDIGRLRFNPIKGFMHGFIDMVFYWDNQFFLVDWKTNFLGDKIVDYANSCLIEVMKKEFYTLQYIIYVIALDQYLKTKLSDYSYENNFGKIYYIFLRGISLRDGPEFGIYTYRPDPEIIRVLRDMLIDI